MKTLRSSSYFGKRRAIRANLNGEMIELLEDSSGNSECDALEGRPVDVHLSLRSAGKTPNNLYRYRVTDIKTLQNKYAKAVALCLSTQTISVRTSQPVKSQIVILETKALITPAAEFCKANGKCLPVVPMSGW